MPKRRWVLLALAGAAVLLLAARAVAQIYVDYEWFEAAGALEVWRARTWSALVMRLLSGLAAGLFVFVNLYAVRHSIVSLDLPRKVANLEIRERVSGRYLMVAVVVISLFLGGVLSLPQDDWTTFSLARSGVLFNESDPYFGGDLGFFVYWLPFEQTLYYSSSCTRSRRACAGIVAASTSRDTCGDTSPSSPASCSSFSRGAFVSTCTTCS